MLVLDAFFTGFPGVGAFVGFVEGLNHYAHFRLSITGSAAERFPQNPERISSLPLKGKQHPG
jgi:hypothetical protein